jgi:hypothetical protein
MYTTVGATSTAAVTGTLAFTGAGVAWEILFAATMIGLGTALIRLARSLRREV